MRTIIVTLLAMLLAVSFPAGSLAAGASDALQQALDAYDKTVRDKLNSDLETIARAFADAREIQKARRWADWAKLPIATTSAVLGAISIIPKSGDILSGLDKAQNQIELLSFLLKLQSLSEAAEGFRLSITGPDYDVTVGKMLAEADNSPDSTSYQNIVLLYLQGIGQRSPTPIVIDSGSGKEVLPGVKEFKDRIWKLVQEAQGRSSGASGISEEKISALTREVEAATARVRESRAKNVEVMPGVILGRINGLERARIAALNNYDSDMRMEQVNTVLSASGSACAMAKYSLPAGAVLSNVQFCAPISATGVVVKSMTLTFKTSARKQVDQIPFEMLVSLSSEAASLWKSAQSISEKVTSVLGGRTPQVASGQRDEPSADEYVLLTAKGAEWTYDFTWEHPGNKTSKGQYIVVNEGTVLVDNKEIVRFSRTAFTFGRLRSRRTIWRRPERASC